MSCDIVDFDILIRMLGTNKRNRPTKQCNNHRVSRIRLFIALQCMKCIERNILIQRHVPSLSTSNDHLTYDTDFHGHDNLFFH